MKAVKLSRKIISNHEVHYLPNNVCPLSPCSKHYQRLAEWKAPDVCKHLYSNPNIGKDGVELMWLCDLNDTDNGEDGSCGE
jgi:hypothetical protein